MTPLREEKIDFRTTLKMVFIIWYRSFVQFRRSLLMSILWIVIEPLFILGAMGFGLGSYISTIDGMPYADFFYPALICISSMFVAYFVSTYDNFSKLTHQQLFATQILSPIEPREIVWGEVLWAATKGTFSAIGVSVVASFFGLVESWRIFPALGVIFLSAMVFAALGLVITTLVKNFDQIIYPSSGLIIPMSLFSGTYFPIEHLPYGLKYIAYLFPLTHAVRIVRGLVLSGFDWWMLLNFSYLLVLLLILVKIAIRRLNQKLLN